MLNHESTAADRVFHALADANRRAIIERLTRAPATVSELVRSEKAGRVRTCQIDSSGLRRAEQWLRQQRTTWEDRLDRLGDVLGESAADHTTTSRKEPRS